jgi:hypothetical protein
MPRARRSRQSVGLRSVGSANVCTHAQRGRCTAGVPADIAQLVERNLAKVEVAGSSPVVRSKASCPDRTPQGARSGLGPQRWSGREARQRPAKPCTRVQIPSPPRRAPRRAIGAAVARFPDTEEVTGSIPVSPTNESPCNARGFVVCQGVRATLRATERRRGDFPTSLACALLNLVLKAPARGNWDPRWQVGHLAPDDSQRPMGYAPVISTSAENRCRWTGQHHRQTLLEVASELNVAGGARVGAR